MNDAAMLWGAHWLGDPDLWGSLKPEMTARWGKGNALPDNEFLAGQSLAPLERLSMSVLNGLLAAGAAWSSATLFYGLRNNGLEQFPLNLFKRPSPFIDCVPVQTRGVVGGLQLVARAQEHLTGSLTKAVCLAEGWSRGENFSMSIGSGSGAAALGLGFDLDQALCRLGPVAQSQYEGIPDSGAQADFLEKMGRQAKVGRSQEISAIVLNRPPDLKWQASLDAAARRIAPLARRYVIPVDPARRAGGLMLIMAGLAIAAPSPQNPRLVLAVDQTGQAAAVTVSPL